MTTIKTRRNKDGSFVEMLADGTTKPSLGKTDWARLDAMTDEEVTAAALSDPDAQPLTDDSAHLRKRMPQTGPGLSR